MQGRLISIVAATLFAGCADTPSPPSVSVASPTRLGERFDGAKSGTIAGDVVWGGAIPSIASFRSVPEPFADQPTPPARDFANPHAPRIDASSRGIGSAVVYLQKVDPERSRAWDHPPVRVELRDQRINVMQGDQRRPAGFVHRGDSVEFVSRDPILHTIQGRGTSFFARTLPRPGEACTRPLSTLGIVELQSGAGYFWMRGYLFVADHPYYAHPDAQGRFLLQDVPAGDYELVAWHPDWRIAQTFRNPDSTRVQQVRFRDAMVTSRRVIVEPRKTTTTRLELSAR